MSNLTYTYTVLPDDFSNAGNASSDLKKKLKLMNISPDIIRRVAIAMYEGEINMVIHAHGGQITVEISPEAITITLTDNGPGIPDIEQAFQEGFSTASDKVISMGFGAGMGLPNMKKSCDNIEINSALGIGTTVTMCIQLK